MTCRILIDAPDGHPIEVRALLDSASSTSFITERLAQCLRLPRSPQKVNIIGIAGLSHKSHNQSVAHFTVSTERPGKGLMLLLSLSHVSLVISLSTPYHLTRVGTTSLTYP